MGIDRSNASLLVERLVERGFVDRRVNPENRRAHLLRLTHVGERAYARSRPSFNAEQNKVLAVLNPGERELFIRLLARIVEGNRSLAKPGTGRRKRVTAVE